MFRGQRAVREVSLQLRVWRLPRLACEFPQTKLPNGKSESLLYTLKRGVHGIAPAVFMKPLVEGGDESLTRPPSHETCKPPA